MTYVDHPFQSPSCISLCTGSRGLERGLERAIGSKLRVLCYVENEAFAVENLVQQMEQGVLDPAPLWTDIKTFQPQSFRHRVHWITAGYPCTPFSNAGLKKGAVDPRHLYPDVFRIVEAIHPLGCFFENVRAHLKMGYDEVYRSLHSIGYSVEVGIYSAAEVGAPHFRERLFILAIDRRMVHAYEQGLEISGQGGEQTIQQENEEKISGTQLPGSEVADTDDLSIRRERGNIRRTGSEIETERDQRKRGRDDIGTGSEESMGDADDTDSREREQPIGPQEEIAATADNGEDVPDTGISKAGIKPTKRKKRSEFDRSSERTGLADTAFIKLQGDGTEGKQEPERQIQEEISGCDSRGARWPAGFGQEQYPWESPRLIPALGCSVNGYNFREDLLRLLGNGVVEQQAQKAFIDLINQLL